jgi:hypothetical protein
VGNAVYRVTLWCASIKEIPCKRIVLMVIRHAEDILAIGST